MSNNKGKRWIGYLLMTIILGLSILTGGLAPSMLEAQNTFDLTHEIDSSTPLIDDIFADVMASYKQLKSSEAERNVKFSEIFLKDSIDEMEQEFFDDFYASYKNNRLMSSGMIERYSVMGKHEIGNTKLKELIQLNGGKSSDYYWYIVLKYDAKGNLSLSNATDEFLSAKKELDYFDGFLSRMNGFNFENILQNQNYDIETHDLIEVQPIYNATFVFALPTQGYEAIMNHEAILPYIGNAGYDFGNVLILLIGCGVVAIVLAILIKTENVDELRSFHSMLRIPFELLASGLFTGIALLPSALLLVIQRSQAWNLNAGVSVAGISLVMFVLLFLVVLSVYAIKFIFIKGGAYFKYHSLSGMLVCQIARGLDVFKELDLENDLMKRMLRFLLINAAVSAIACMLWGFGIVVVLVFFVLNLIYFNRLVKRVEENYKNVSHVAKEISLGNLDVDVNEDFGVFNGLKDDFVSIKDGFKKAVEEEVKSQRMKSELISNVSHDLKTPLTTMISYIDLLSNPDIDEKEKANYLVILQNSSQRLKRCIEDLFEISKVESGNVQVNLVDINLCDLIRQTAFELDDKISNSTLIFKTSLPEHKVICRLDSSKTYRIFENLYLNILKYAMPNTRVYISLEEVDGEAMIIFRNISATEITYTAEELSERFVRNDASRNSEGSGLGLAIVKSFTELQGGNFKIELDGDLFKVSLRFKMIQTDAKVNDEGVKEDEVNPQQPQEEENTGE